VKWLYDWWKRIDSWISQNQPGQATVPEAIPEPDSDTAEPVAELATPSRVSTAGLPLAGDEELMTTWPSGEAL
jgi:hypothetical protein